jgi:hypothetical protein
MGRTHRPTYQLSPGDVLIDTDGTCLQIVAVDDTTTFDDDGLVSGGMDTQEITYLQTLEQFDQGQQVLDLAGDYPGLWSHR